MTATSGQVQLTLIQKIYRKFFADKFFGPSLKKIILPIYLQFEKVLIIYRTIEFVKFNLFWHTNSPILNSAIVTGGSRFIIQNNKCFLNVIYPTRDLREIYKKYFFQEELFGILTFFPDKEMIATSKPKLKIKLPGTWLNLLSHSSTTWMHFLSEYAAILESIINKHSDLDFGILYEADLPAQALECLQILAARRRLYPVSYRQNILIEKLIIPEHNSSTCISVWPRKGYKGTGHYEFDNKSLLSVRAKLLSHHKIDANRANNIFINRESHFRFITNNDAIQQLLQSKGFVNVLPGKMTLQEQIKVFSQARLVVVQAGSALGNIMFMPEGSQVICMCAKSEWANYAYFIDYAKIFNVKIRYINGIIENPQVYDNNKVCTKTHPMNANFHISLQELEEALSMDATGSEY